MRVNFVVLKSSTGRTNQQADTLTKANTNADAYLSTCNNVMRRLHRGLRFARQGDCQYLVHSATVNVNQFFPMTWEKTDAITDATTANPSNWLASSTACNFYIVDGEKRGTDPAPSSSFTYFGGGFGDATNNRVVQSGFGFNPGFHELGHWMGIPHTFYYRDAPGCGPYDWSDDGLSDTLRDSGNFIRTYDGEANCAFNKTFVMLDSTEKSTVINTLQNYYATLYFSKAYSELSAFQKTRIIELDGNSAADLELTRRNGIATQNFAGSNGRRYFYDEITPNQQLKVEALIANYDAYHTGKGSETDGLLTEQQLDLACDLLSADHAAVATGKCLFVGPQGNTPRDGSSKKPWATVAAAAAAITPTAGKLDQIYLEPGNHAGAITISKPCIIRPKSKTATDTHQPYDAEASIGKP